MINENERPLVAGYCGGESFAITPQTSESGNLFHHFGRGSAPKPSRRGFYPIAPRGLAAILYVRISRNSTWQLNPAGGRCDRKDMTTKTQHD
jgi:hypothetical protein